MVCSEADKSPIGVIVRSPESGKLKKGTWVKVHGKVGFTTFEGEDSQRFSSKSGKDNSAEKSLPYPTIGK